MPRRSGRERIAGILEAIARIERYTEGHGQATFCADDMLVDAVIRNIAVIGEAASHVPEEMRSRHPEVPWDRIRGMRNALVHEYFGIGLDILWNTVSEDLPVLRVSLRAIFERDR